MRIIKETQERIDTLGDYKEVTVCILEGVEHPIILRNNTMDRYVYDEIFLHRCYDAEMTNSLKYRNYKSRFSVRPPRFIIDIGGNIGLAAVYYAIMYPDATIISIEPDLSNFIALCENTKHYKNIIAVRGAVWGSKTKVSITNRSQAFTGGQWVDGKRVNGIFNSGKFIVEEKSVDGEDMVETFTIDELIEKFDIDKIDILKIDCEGGEREIFSGEYEKWLPKVKVLVFEHHDFYKDGCTKAAFRAISNYDFHFLYDNSDSLQSLMFVFDMH